MANTKSITDTAERKKVKRAARKKATPKPKRTVPRGSNKKKTEEAEPRADQAVIAERTSCHPRPGPFRVTALAIAMMALSEMQFQERGPVETDLRHEIHRQADP